jgi:hypothetical protein
MRRRSGSLHRFRPRQGTGVTDVAAVGGDVEVAEHDERAGGLAGAAQPGGERVQPAQLQLVPGGTRPPAVHQVDVDDLYYPLAHGRENRVLRPLADAKIVVTPAARNR